MFVSVIATAIFALGKGVRSQELGGSIDGVLE